MNREDSAPLLFDSKGMEHTVVFRAGLTRLRFLPFVLTVDRSSLPNSLRSSDSG